MLEQFALRDLPNEARIVAVKLLNVHERRAAIRELLRADADERSILILAEIGRRDARRLLGLDDIVALDKVRRYHLLYYLSTIQFYHPFY